MEKVKLNGTVSYNFLLLFIKTRSLQSVLLIVVCYVGYMSCIAILNLFQEER